ncbi:MAG: hypothetical protein JRI68_19970 [Deltaproteobacteria bacterium]|nr:hypothetical protein [Deltaproteobacteria bacterium]
MNGMTTTPSPRWAAALAVALLVACGSDTTTSGGGGGGAGGAAGQGGTTSSGTGGGGQGGSSAPNADCLDLCAETTLTCYGPDTENGSATISEVTATSCTATVDLPSSGPVTVTLDCVAEEVCVTAGGANCVGTPGECYETLYEPTAFSYTITNCMHGSLSCGVVN